MNQAVSQPSLRSKNKRRKPGKRLSGNYGLSDSQYPFRPREDHPEDEAFIRLEIERVLYGVTDMIYMLVRRRLYTQNEDMIEDVAQMVRCNLWEKSLPAFDSHRQVTLSTYLYCCINNFVKREGLRQVRQEAKRETPVDPAVLCAAMDDMGKELDSKVYALAQDIMANPEKYLTRRQSTVLREVLAYEGDHLNVLAEQFDYHQPSSLYMMLRRIRDRIKALSIEDGPLP